MQEDIFWFFVYIQYYFHKTTSTLSEEKATDLSENKTFVAAQVVLNNSESR
jgi:hypothetical protein